MIDPIPAGFTSLQEAVVQLAAKITDRDIAEARSRLQRLRKVPPSPEAQSNNEDPYSRPSKEALSVWEKREFAILKLREALQCGALFAYVRDPVTGNSFRMTTADWWQAAYWRDIILGGQVKASVGENIERHATRTVLIETAELDKWLKRKQDRQTRAADKDCFGWLEGEMRADPRPSAKLKREWLAEAKEKFGVSERAFNNAWASAIRSTGSEWGHKGRKPVQ